MNAMHTDSESQSPQQQQWTARRGGAPTASPRDAHHDNATNAMRRGVQEHRSGGWEDKGGSWGQNVRRGRQAGFEVSPPKQDSGAEFWYNNLERWIEARDTSPQISEVPRRNALLYTCGPVLVVPSAAPHLGLTCAPTCPPACALQPPLTPLSRLQTPKVSPDASVRPGGSPCDTARRGGRRGKGRRGRAESPSQQAPPPPPPPSAPPPRARASRRANRATGREGDRDACPTGREGVCVSMGGMRVHECHATSKPVRCMPRGRIHDYGGCIRRGRNESGGGGPLPS